MKYTTRSWWRTAKVASLAEAQTSLDRWSVDVADRRDRPAGTVGELGAGEPLKTLPAAAYPAMITVARKASRSALVAFEANHYSAPPAQAGRTVTVQTRVGEPSLRSCHPRGRSSPPIAGRQPVPDRPQLAGDGQVATDPELVPIESALPEIPPPPAPRRPVDPNIKGQAPSPMACIS